MSTVKSNPSDACRERCFEKSRNDFQDERDVCAAVDNRSRSRFFARLTRFFYPQGEGVEIRVIHGRTQPAVTQLAHFVMAKRSCETVVHTTPTKLTYPLKEKNTAALTHYNRGEEGMLRSGA